MSEKIVLIIAALFLSIAGSASELRFEEVVHHSINAELNAKLFAKNSFWKDEVVDVYWNEIAYFHSDGGKYCLMYRRLKQKNNAIEGLVLTRSSLRGECIQHLEEPVWELKDIKEVKVELDENRFFLSYLKGERHSQLEWALLSNQKAFTSIRLKQTAIWSPAEFLQKPCASFGKKCEPLVTNLCHLCPNGVRGYFEKNACAGQELYCRSSPKCGASEQPACQRFKETSANCEVSKEAYFCQENLNMVCEKGRINCY